MTTKKKNVFVKTWERCRSMRNRESSFPTTFSKSKSWHGPISGSHKVAPDGCFSVYVGPDKERFAIKAKYANHPLFQMLLEDAEMEYGYTSQGPILLPCDVDLFYKVLAEIGCSQHDHGFVSGSSCSPFVISPYGSGAASSYKVLTPPPILKFNQYYMV
ncbi:auxin-responsive protein SAUR71-like [Impatiens glandulifera]|uniref:auxin-responsive protein SAUR71-like n=1 Tax=Impatiens glandulifera TaxID=253017 RepID=UPI001FB07FE2|nr:auxin-responsive protein SAUR71-like [Impatiens glandulifera]